MPADIPLASKLFESAGYYTCNETIHGSDGKQDYNFVSKHIYTGTSWKDSPEGIPFFAQIQLHGGKNRKKIVDSEDFTLPPYYHEDSIMRYDWKSYLGSWLETDKEVQQIITDLKAEGVYDNTLIILLTDHGISHLRGKQFLYDEGIKVPLIVKFPEKLWISDVFKRYKGIRMEIINFFPYDFERSIGNAIIEIMYFDIDSIIEAVRSHPSVFEFSEIEREENRIRFNVKTKDPYQLYGVIKCGVLIDFPINVREGYAYWRLVSTRKRIDDLLTLFEQRNVDFTLLRIGSSPYEIDDNKDKLTLEESEVLDMLLKSKYYIK